jgi:hypothetical protein
MNFSVLPPQINSTRMFSGAGSGPMLAAAMAWDGLAGELSAVADSFSLLTSGLADQAWQGPASAAMAAAAGPYTGWLSTAAAHASGAAEQAKAVVSAFEAARAATVRPEVVAANRAQLASLAGSNVFGLNAPAIAAVESEFEQMWAQDVAAMVGYHSAATAAVGQLMPWQQPPQSLPGQALESSASTRITAGPAVMRQDPLISFLKTGLPSYAELCTALGENFLPDTTPEVVRYPATAGMISGLGKPTADQSLAIGQEVLNTDILSATGSGQRVVVAGESMGTIVIDREEAYLATAPNAPAPNQVSFVEFSNPERGLADTYLPAGTHVPILGYTVGEAPVSQYDTSVVYHQYEGFADPPDRPWNLLADANALAGMGHFHLATEFASQSQAVEVSSVTNSLGGTTSTYVIPTSTLPLLMPLEHFGVPSPIVDELNAALTPIVNEGYSQYDPSGGPYLSRGQLVW